MKILVGVGALLLASLFHSATFAQVGTDRNYVPFANSGTSIVGSFSSAGSDGRTVALRGNFNVAFTGVGLADGSAATLRVERSFDGGATWFATNLVGIQAAGNALNQTADFNRSLHMFGAPGSTIAGSFVLAEPEAAVLYRVVAVSIPGGATITYRLSQ